jgi:hypothetical protein
MKKILVVLFALGIGFSSFAQKGHVITRGYYYSPRVVFGLGAYSPFYYPYYGMGINPYYPYGPYAYGHRPSKLDMKVADIRNDYEDKIKSAKADHTIAKKERKEIVHKLKQERDQAIDDLKRNYYKS